MTLDPRLAPAHAALRRLEADGAALTAAEASYRRALDQHRSGTNVARAEMALSDARREMTNAAVEAHRAGVFDLAARAIATARVRQPDPSRVVDVDDEVPE